jgi:hypothetical protein
VLEHDSDPSMQHSTFSLIIGGKHKPLLKTRHSFSIIYLANECDARRDDYVLSASPALIPDKDDVHDIRATK